MKKYPSFLSSQKPLLAVAVLLLAVMACARLKATPNSTATRIETIPTTANNPWLVLSGGDPSKFPNEVSCENVPLPPEDDFPYDYWGHIDLPENKEMQIVNRYCSMSPSEWETFYAQQIAQAQELSDELENYIRLWLQGETDPRIPDDLLPSTMVGELIRSWTLLRPEEVDPRNQWYWIPARPNPTDFTLPVLRRANAETHVTYLRAVFIAPFGSELIVEGDFPHARFLDFQIQEPFDPRYPVTGSLGQIEVPLVDIDIEPDPGHVNPFRISADRNAILRHYHVTFQLEMGNAADLNPEAMVAPEFRAPGNNRVGGPMAASGPMGDGMPTPSILWMRTYAPDLGTGPLGGVDLPKALLRLDTGETFWIQPDLIEMLRRDCPVMGEETRPVAPPDIIGPDFGWFKMFDGFTMYAEGWGLNVSVLSDDMTVDEARQAIRGERTCFFNRGPDKAPPGNLTPGTTLVPYINYLTRPTAIGQGKILVFTGRLPTTPATRNGEPVMESADLRYWSICHSGHGPEGLYRGVVYGCLMDDEITVDSNRDYIIVYSRPENRPENAHPECGVTWQERSPEEPQGVLIRWMSVYPDHASNLYVPTDTLVPWSAGSWSEDAYDPTLIGQNTPGVMGHYHPVLHYLTPEEFEALGCPVNPVQVPEW